MQDEELDQLDAALVALNRAATEARRDAH
jgi:hypothetical protein